MNKVRWGVLSTAKIGIEKVLPAMQQGELSEIIAIASNNLEKAQAAAMKLGIPTAYGSYAELLSAPEVDAVYIPLPNHLHVPWSIKALEAGKHVLCEKPIAMTAAEAQKLRDTAEKYPALKIMEAFMYRHHPQWQHARQLVKDGKIGDLHTIQSFFSYHNVDPVNIRNKAETGGGGLMDIGCYCISLSRFIFGAEPRRVCGIMQYDPKFKTDCLTSGILDFDQGTSTFSCSTQLAPFQRVNIFGTEGRIEIDVPFNPLPDQPSKIKYQHGNEISRISLDLCDQYKIQGDLFSKAVRDDSPVPTPLADAVANMQVIDALIQSARDGIWVK
jgi:predicted dehydrogenase